jgi:hypothetical protein
MPVLLLAFLLGLGMSVSAFHDRLIAAEVTVMADHPHHLQGGCHGCGGDHESMDPGTCLAACGTAAHGLMPGELLTLPSDSGTDFRVAQLLLSGQFHSPDHGPPKVLALG